MDEKDDYLRVVTTLNKSKITTENEVSSAEFLPTSNNLYILDSNLKTVGAIENIAENETVYSVRFDGDIGYFVTFRQVDPLFSVDLSNPSNPFDMQKASSVVLISLLGSSVVYFAINSIPIIYRKIKGGTNE